MSGYRVVGLVRLTSMSWCADGRSDTFLARQSSTNVWNSEDQSPPDRVGESFCAMWYKALIAFMLNSGGFLSATTHTTRLIQIFTGGSGLIDSSFFLTHTVKPALNGTLLLIQNNVVKGVCRSLQQIL